MKKAKMCLNYNDSDEECLSCHGYDTQCLNYEEDNSPYDCHSCEHCKADLKEFDAICELTKESVLDFTDRRHPKCPLI